MEPVGAAEAADLNRILIAKPALSRTSTRATHARGPSLRREVRETSLCKISGCEVEPGAATGEIKDSGDSSADEAATSGSAIDPIAGLETDTGATNRYPMRGTV